jgi:hypothetical protein
MSAMPDGVLLIITLIVTIAIAMLDGDQQH